MTVTQPFNIKIYVKTNDTAAALITVETRLTSGSTGRDFYHNFLTPSQHCASPRTPSLLLPFDQAATCLKACSGENAFNGFSGCLLCTNSLQRSLEISLSSREALALLEALAVEAKAQEILQQTKRTLQLHTLIVQGLLMGSWVLT